MSYSKQVRLRYIQHTLAKLGLEHHKHIIQPFVFNPGAWVVNKSLNKVFINDMEITAVNNIEVKIDMSGEEDE